MKTLRTVTDLRGALAEPHRAGRTIGLVPTMGALHDGHLALIHAARERCDIVVASLFVNPAQFGPQEDLAAYPRDEHRDAALASESGVDVLFAPAVSDVYPAGFGTTVTVDRALTGVLCGAQRGPEHFDGVVTVVVKLLNMADPDVAFFGQKDAQQALVIRRAVRDLDLPVEIAVVPTVREPDGLARSSRNAYLDGAERARAVALSRALRAAAHAVADGERDAGALLTRARAAMEPYGVEPEYLELVAPQTLTPVARLDGEALLAVAARVGPARLIDNEILSSNGRSP